MAFKQWIRRLFRRTPAQQSPSTKQEYMSLHGKSVLDVNKALETIYRKGVEHGQQMQPPLYGTACPVHHLPLQETDPGLYACFVCHTPTQQQTQPLPVARPGDPLQHLPLGARARHQWHHSLQETERMAAMTLRERHAMMEEMP